MQTAAAGYDADECCMRRLQTFAYQSTAASFSHGHFEGISFQYALSQFWWRAVFKGAADQVVFVTSCARVCAPQQGAVGLHQGSSFSCKTLG